MFPQKPLREALVAATAMRRATGESYDVWWRHQAFRIYPTRERKKWMADYRLCYVVGETVEAGPGVPRPEDVLCT